MSVSIFEYDSKIIYCISTVCKIYGIATVEKFTKVEIKIAI